MSNLSQTTASTHRALGDDPEPRTLYAYNDFARTKFVVKTDPHATFDMIRDVLRKKYEKEPLVSAKGKFKLKMRIA